jgi:NADH-quinone oxidoreductase subunit N
MNGLLPGGETVVLWAPLAVLAATALAVLAADAVAGSQCAIRSALAGLSIAFVAEVFAAARPVIAALGGALLLGGTRATLTAMVTGLAVLALVAGYQHLGEETHGGQVAALVVFSVLGCGTLIAAGDLAVLAVSLEMLALAGYALVSASRDPRADEAAAKYFVQGAVATGLLVYGTAVVFGVYGGVTRYADLSRTLASASPTAPAVTGTVLVLAALAFKLGAFPFHWWAPDAYETAQPSVAAFLAAGPKVAALAAAGVLTLRVFSGQLATLVPLAVGLGVASIVFGNLGGLRQVSYQRMLAYSGIAQVGYALAAFSAGAAGLAPALMLGGAYAVAAAGAFIAGQALRADAPHWDGSIGGMGGLARRRPVLSASLAVCLVSLTGIPLTAGFWGKLFAFGVAARVAVEPALRPAADAWLYWTVLIAGVIGSVVSFGYYGGVLRSVYFDEANCGDTARGSAEAGDVAGVRIAGDPARSAVAAVVIAAGVLLVVGIAPLVLGPSWLIAAFSAW